MLHVLLPLLLEHVFSSRYYAHVQTVYTRLFFSPPTKSLGTKLGTVKIVKGQILKFKIHNPDSIVTELKVCFINAHKVTYRTVSKLSPIKDDN